MATKQLTLKEFFKKLNTRLLTPDYDAFEIAVNTIWELQRKKNNKKSINSWVKWFNNYEQEIFDILVFCVKEKHSTQKKAFPYKKATTYANRIMDKVYFKIQKLK